MWFLQMAQLSTTMSARPSASAVLLRYPPELLALTPSPKRHRVPLHTASQSQHARKAAHRRTFLTSNRFGASVAAAVVAGFTSESTSISARSGRESAVLRRGGQTSDSPAIAMSVDGKNLGRSEASKVGEQA